MCGLIQLGWVEPPERAPRGTKIDHFGENMTIYTVK